MYYVIILGVVSLVLLVIKSTCLLLALRTYIVLIPLILKSKMYYALQYVQKLEVSKGEVKYDYDDPKPPLFARIFLWNRMIFRVLKLF